jgi:hypothetical protein
MNEDGVIQKTPNKVNGSKLNGESPGGEATNPGQKRKIGGA